MKKKFNKVGMGKKMGKMSLVEQLVNDIVDKVDGERILKILTEMKIENVEENTIDDMIKILEIKKCERIRHQILENITKAMRVNLNKMDVNDTKKGERYVELCYCNGGYPAIFLFKIISKKDEILHIKHERSDKIKGMSPVSGEYKLEFSRFSKCYLYRVEE